MDALNLSLLLLALQDATAPALSPAWSEASIAQARATGRPLVLLIGDPGCPGCREREQEALAALSPDACEAASLVCARSDRWARPDLDDFYATAATLFDVERRYPLVAATDASGWPYRVASLGSAPAAELARFAHEAARLWRDERGTVESSLAHARDGLALAQHAGAPLHDLGQADLDGRLRGLEECASADPRLSAPALLFLLAEHERTGSARALRLARAALDDPRTSAGRPALAQRALLLKCFARAYSATGAEAYRDTAVSLVAELERLRGTAGWLSSSPEDRRAITGWNGLAAGALAESGRRLGRPQDVALATALATAVLTRVDPGDPPRLLDAPASGPVLLEDHAYLAEGLLALFDATHEARWWRSARSVVDAALARFLAGSGAFYLTLDGSDAPPVRLSTSVDGELPAPNAVMASVLSRLAAASGEARYATLARRSLDAFAGDLQRAPRGMETLAAALGQWLGRPSEPSRAPVAFPARAVRPGVTLEATLRPASVRPGASYDASIRFRIAPGWQVVAHDASVRDLVGLVASAPGARPASRPRYPDARRVRGPWGSEPVAVYIGDGDVVLPLQVGRDARAGERLVRLRVVFQACRDLSCEAPQSVDLDAALRVEADR